MVYLIHLDSPLSDRHTAQHYLGTCRNVSIRMEQHLRGRGARFMEVTAERGISWRIARLWQGGRKLEKQLKRRKNAPKLCPVCKAARRQPAGQLPLDFPDPLDSLL